MAVQTYLAVDLGAESGRGVLVAFDGERLSLRELGRFATGRGSDDIGADGVRRWDLERLWGEIDGLLGQARGASPDGLDGVGVDSWGCDFGLLDPQGRLLEPPMHYRNDANPAAMQRAFQVMPPEEIWDATGIQNLPFNTLYQLNALQQRRPELLNQADRLLLMPDLIHHRLTGGRSRMAETTNASTSQCLDPNSRQWHTALLGRFGLPSQFLGPLVQAGTRVGQTGDGVPVYASATHDTASAVAAVPAAGAGAWAFLSSGTWSLLGVERPGPDLSRDAFQMGLSNEGGVAGTTRLLKNIMGLWLVQECRRALRAEDGRDLGYAELAALAEAAPPDGPCVDATDHRFLAPPDMAAEIRAACRESGQAAPDGPGPLIRCCLDSLALAYRQTMQDLERLLGLRFEALHIVGGGVQNRLLNQLAADACGVPVLAGPSEATAVGNALGQLVAAGVVGGWAQAREVCRRSFSPEPFLPRPESQARWQERDEINTHTERGER